jgi:uronate dehydrogenase
MNTAAKTHTRILLTGAAGGLGQALRSRLNQNCDVLRLSDKVDLGAPQANEECVMADLAQASQVDAAVAGCQAIVHLGGISVEAPFEAIMQANILGLYHLYEAARRHGPHCRRHSPQYFAGRGRPGHFLCAHHSWQ